MQIVIPEIITPKIMLVLNHEIIDITNKTPIRIQIIPPLTVKSV